MDSTKVTVRATSSACMKENFSHENYDPCFPDQPVVDLYLPIWANLPSFKSKPAFIWYEDGAATKSVLTYTQLNSSGTLIVSQLLIPTTRGDTVIVLCPPSLLLVKALFACQRAGLMSVPIFIPEDSPSSNSTKKSFDHLSGVILQTKPRAILATRRQISSIPHHLSSPNNDQLSQLLQKLKWLSVDNLESSGCEVSSKDDSNYNGCKSDDVCLVQYTSGATGIPKPVLVTAGAAAHNVRVARKAYDLHPNSVIVSWLPQYHDCGLMFLLLTVVSGATCVLTSPTTFVNRPRCWLELITEFEATCTPVPSFALPLVVRRGGINQGDSPLRLDSLSNLVLINEPIYKEFVGEFINEFVKVGLCPSSLSPSYGLAENCTFVSTAWQRANGSNLSNFPNIPSYKKLLPSAMLASQGEADMEMEILVVNEETGVPVKDGVEGEIWVSSPSNALGYLGYPSLTQEVFYGRPEGKVGLTFLKTGDRGIVLGEDRYLFVMGQVADIIKTVDGSELHPHYLETAAYKSCPKQLRGGCIAAFELSTRIAIVAELQKGQESIDFLKKICERIWNGVMKHEKVSVGLVVLVKSGSVPKTSSGKLRRCVAKEKLMNGEMVVVAEAWFVDGKMNINSSLAGHKMGDERGETKALTDHQNRSHLLSLL